MYCNMFWVLFSAKCIEMISIHYTHEHDNLFNKNAIFFYKCLVKGSLCCAFIKLHSAT